MDALAAGGLSRCRAWGPGRSRRASPRGRPGPDSRPPLPAAAALPAPRPGPGRGVALCSVSRPHQESSHPYLSVLPNSCLRAKFEKGAVRYFSENSTAVPTQMFKCCQDSGWFFYPLTLKEWSFVGNVFQEVNFIKNVLKYS